MRVLRPLIVVLGGVRVTPVESLHRKTMRTRTVRRRLNGVLAATKKSRDTTILLYPQEARAAGRFRKNVAAVLRDLTYSTPLGRIALRDSAVALAELREHALGEAMEHNRENPHWHVLVEGPTWSTLEEDACSILLTVLGGRLPDWMFEERS